jgi:uncharacterized membrane protein
MKMIRRAGYISLLLVSLLVLCSSGIVLAQEEGEEEPTPVLISAEEEEPAGEIKMVANYPTVEAVAGGNFQYEIELTYTGDADALVFDLNVDAPVGWDAYVTPRYEEDRKISSINLESSYTTGETIIVFATAPFWPLPDPGKNTITVEATSGNIHGSVELTAEIIAKYILITVPSNELYNTDAKAGEDNFFPIDVQNMGSAAIDNIKFSSTQPDGWLIDFEPDTIESLEAIDEQTVNVNIQPPAKAVAGDYMISVRASGSQISADEVNIRVTVETPTIWGWVGVAIILVVVAGLILIFMRFGRR